MFWLSAKPHEWTKEAMSQSKRDFKGEIDCINKKSTSVLTLSGLILPTITNMQRLLQIASSSRLSGCWCTKVNTILMLTYSGRAAGYPLRKKTYALSGIYSFPSVGSDMLNTLVPVALHIPSCAKLCVSFHDLILH